MSIKKPKSASGKKALLKAAPAEVAQVIVPDVVYSDLPSAAAPELRKKELIDTVVERSGIKKRDVKPVIEAMLAVLGENIADGRDINIPPFGKLKVTRMKKTTKASVMTMRLRRSETTKVESTDPLAQAAE